MKTKKDALEFYNYEWPEDRMGASWIGIGVNSDGKFTAYQNNSFISESFGGCYPVCTREEFEKEAAEHKAKQRWIPEVGQECEVSNCNNDWIWCLPRYIGTQICVVDHDSHIDQHYHMCSVKFRPIKTEREKIIESLDLTGDYHTDINKILDKLLPNAKAAQ